MRNKSSYNQMQAVVNFYGSKAYAAADSLRINTPPIKYITH